MQPILVRHECVQTRACMPWRYASFQAHVLIRWYWTKIQTYFLEYGEQSETFTTQMYLFLEMMQFNVILCNPNVFHYTCSILIWNWSNTITVTSLWARWRLKSPASRLFTQPFVQAQIKENIKAPRHWPLCEEFTGDRWIPRTNGQEHGKCFHLMTSPCND